ncbi:hypothetical protein BGZ72_010864 [Mortierella alpina]|nr:hypothetical protein BGZ72_010864 [Mortierella alpina]
MHTRAAFLPPIVSNLVCFDKTDVVTGEFSLDVAPPLITGNGLLSIEAMARFVPQAVLVGPFTKAPDPQALCPFKGACVTVYAALQSLLHDRSLTLQEVYSEQLEWLGASGKRAGEIWIELFAGQQYDQAWLVGSTVLEQLLGNIIFTLESQDKFIPFLVRDLLAVPCLKKSVDPTLMGILKTMMGSPMTLNIRNLLWHGFIIPQDPVPLDAYGAMLIAVTMTIAASAQTKLQGPLQERHLAAKMYYPSNLTQVHTTEDFDAVYERLAFDTTHPSLDWNKYSTTLESLIAKSSFVTPGTQKQWTLACRHLRHAETNAPFVFVMATLPLMEHALRHVYVTANGCKEDRKNALIEGEYYLTLDVILDHFVPAAYYSADALGRMECDPSKILNKLHTNLGPEVMNVFKDLFLLGSGPRLRDRTSHGELNVYLTRDISAEPWFGYYMGLITHLLRRSLPDSLEETGQDVLNQCTSWIANYSTCHFDDWAILKKEVARCQTLLAAYHSTVTITNESLDDNHLASWEGVDIILKPQFSVLFSNQQIFALASLEDQIQECLDAWQPTNPHDVGESMFGGNLPAWILIIQSIQEAIQKVSLKVLTLAKQLRNRQLSSRSRKQFEAMRPMVPRLLGMLVGCLALVEHFVLRMPGTPKVPSCPTSRESRSRTPQVISVDALSPGASTPATPSTPLPTCNSKSGTPADRSAAAEIRLRSKLTTFVDKFVSNFDRVKLTLIESAWEDLLRGVDAVGEEKFTRAS